MTLDLRSPRRQLKRVDTADGARDIVDAANMTTLAPSSRWSISRQRPAASHIIHATPFHVRLADDVSRAATIRTSGIVISSEPAPPRDSCV